MPNHCSNYATISGSKNNIKAFLNYIQENKAVFAFIAKCPDELMIESPVSKENEQKGLENIQKYGVPTWYEWCNANWGTKWDAYDIVIMEEHDDSFSLYFNTAWNPPLRFYELLVKRGYQVDAYYCELGNYFSGHWINGDDEHYEGMPDIITEIFDIPEVEDFV